MANDRSYWKRALIGFQKADACPWALRLRLLRAVGWSIHDDAFVESGVEVVAGQVSVGSRAYINRGSLIDARGEVAIGAATLIGPRVTILTATHPIMPHRTRAGPVAFEPVRIGAGAWIGAGSLILPGAVIGDGCVVAAGSVVRGVLADDTLYAGVPALAKRQL